MTLVIVGIAGLLLGSFVNVLILRTREGASWIKGRSACPKCHKQLSWYELIPVLSYVLQAGKCRKCHKPISAQYPIVELLTAIVFVISYQIFAPISVVEWVSFVILLKIELLLIASAVYDARWQQLPDSFSLPALGLSLILVIITATSDGNLSIIVSRLIAASGGAALVYLLWSISKGRWIGDGDIRIVVIMGLLLSATSFLVGLFVAINAAAIVALALIATKRKKRHDHIPLGTFLILGTFVALFWGNDIYSWYLNVSLLQI